MNFVFALALFTFVAMVTGRPAIEENSESRENVESSGTQNNTIFTTPWETNMNLNSNDVSEYLRCASCITECVNVHNPLSYYLCRNCLASCANRTDAFMQFFSSHRCEVTPQPVSGRGITPDEVLGGVLLAEDETTPQQQVASPGPADSEHSQVAQNKGLNLRKGSNNDYDYLDQYMTKRFFNKNTDDCAVRQEQFDALHSKYAQCLTDLGNCNSNWPAQQENTYQGTDQIDYPNYDVDYPEESPDKERSAMPVTSHPNLDPATLSGNTKNPDLKRQGPQTGNNNEKTSFQTVNPKIKRANLRIIKHFKSMFVTTDEYEKLSKESWSKKPKQLVNIKSIGHNSEYEEEQKVAVCPTRFKVHSPMKVAHRSGDFYVELLRDDEYVQPFIVAECSSKKPTIGLLDNAECATVSVQRNAVMIIPEEKEHMFDNCMEYDDGRLACRDWISLPGACSLFL
uniref:uncharacterized protein LOC120325666 n=1 Tax=Styela clava TaxID=7725 RepID=UPI00193AB672|nr:uncharacterized protein LOC120325666 [Styela clava]